MQQGDFLSIRDRFPDRLKNDVALESAIAKKFSQKTLLDLASSGFRLAAQRGLRRERVNSDAVGKVARNVCELGIAMGIEAADSLRPGEAAAYPWSEDNQVAKRTFEISMKQGPLAQDLARAYPRVARVVRDLFKTRPALAKAMCAYMAAPAFEEICGEAIRKATSLERADPAAVLFSPSAEGFSSLLIDSTFRAVFQYGFAVGAESALSVRYLGDPVARSRKGSFWQRIFPGRSS